MKQDELLKNKKKITWRRILKSMEPFSTEPLTLFAIIARGESNKEKRIMLLTLRIVHLLCIATVPIAILFLTLILPRNGFVLHTESLGEVVVVFYIGSILLAIMGNKWSSVAKWFKFDSSKCDDLWSSHVFRILVNFEVIIFLGFILGLAGNWYIFMPLFILAEVGLILTYPTDKKWAKWLNKEKLSNKAI